MHYGLSSAGVGIGIAGSRGASVTPWYRAGGAPAPVAAYAAVGAASYAASLVNLAGNATYDATVGKALGGWSPAAGWQFTAHDQWLNTNVVPQTAWAALIRFSDISGTGNYYAFGTYASDNSKHFSFYPSQTSKVGYMCGAALAVSPAATSGVFGFAGKAAYRNGIADGTIGAGGSTIAVPIALGNLNYSGRTYGIIGNVQAFVVWSDTTGYATWMPAVSAAMAALVG
jgi:hypothetical protein